MGCEAPIASAPYLSITPNNLPPSSMPRRDGGGALPHQERLALGRREADRQRGFASTSHIETSQAGDYGSFGPAPEILSFVSSFQGHQRSFREEYHRFGKESSHSANAKKGRMEGVKKHQQPSYWMAGIELHVMAVAQFLAVCRMLKIGSMTTSRP